MGCAIREQFDLCPKQDECDKESCSWGASLKSLLKYSKIPAVQMSSRVLTPQEVDIEAFTRLFEISEDIYDRVNTPDYDSYRNVLICSNNCGNGKTAWAIKLMQKYFIQIAATSYLDAEDKGIYHGCFVPTNQLIFDAKQFGTATFYKRFDEMAQQADRADITIFDDIGAADYSKYDYSTLFVTIDRRLFAHKFCIFTTNFTSQEDLGEAVGKRLADRIWRTSEIIEFKGDGIRC